MELSDAQEDALCAAVDKALDRFADAIRDTARAVGEHPDLRAVAAHRREARTLILDAVLTLSDDPDEDDGPDWSPLDLSLEPEHAATLQAVNALSPG